ncbi:hypothetical protein E1B28_006096 [Marasmius oreades]|uniref:C2H2-type domain-containing protein n=1 Tax=Marasmius oreades TaxID=181124 RepID=A0A9P7S515_9AGAR|nr:uncharacterized protein E1B28_006096 [Marasmius oreades]KAG7095333.1 hypothetical protein E1B28_006096 [Marasmius oreades]
MPSSSSSPSSSPVMVSLPSIHEMFPEHLMKLSPALRLSIASVNASTSSPESPLSKPRYSPTSLPNAHTSSNRLDGVVSFDVWRSDPSLPTLQHIASSATLPNRTSGLSGATRPIDIANGSAPAFRVNPPLSKSRQVDRPSNHSHPGVRHNCSPVSASPSDLPYQSSTEDMSDDGGDDKKHICTTCHKRFNRPSSLRIHMNTHTGATPFRCPYPNCGREFNVNSNMRRHYRNHCNPSQGKGDDPSSNPHSSVTRRRQRRVDPQPPTNRDFLVLRPDAIPKKAVRSRTVGDQSSWLSTGNTSPSLSGDSDGDNESLIDDEDELMHDASYSYSSVRHHYEDSATRNSHLYRLQPVSDFSTSRYHPQSDIRSLPPTLTCNSASSCSSPSASPVSSFGPSRR